METIQQQIGALQVIVAKQQASTKRQRFAIIALTGIIVAGGFIAAVRPAGDATFDTITCKGWSVVGKDGKMRIAAVTLADGETGVFWYDKDGKGRIGASTLADGSASVRACDKDEKVRIIAFTHPNGQAGVQWNDKDGKMRINAFTHPNGQASVSWLDKDGKTRIAMGIGADGTVVLPTKDLEPPKKP